MPATAALQTLERPAMALFSGCLWWNGGEGAGLGLLVGGLVVGEAGGYFGDQVRGQLLGSRGRRLAIVGRAAELLSSVVVLGWLLVGGGRVVVAVVSLPRLEKKVDNKRHGGDCYWCCC